MKRSTSSARAGVATLVVLLWAREAAAGPRWIVDASGATCIAHRAQLEREIALACAAVGSSCHVVDKPEEAELRATLGCDGIGGRWSLETQTIEGARLGRIELEGDDEDRLRQAAMEVARDAAPERVLAVDALRDTLVPADRVTPPPDGGSRLAFAAAARGAVMTDATPLAGGRVMVGHRFSSLVTGTFGGGGELGGSGLAARRHGRGMLGAVLGAPFQSERDSYFGLGAELGLDIGQGYPDLSGVSSSSSFMIAPQVKAGLAVQASLYLQSKATAGGFRFFGALSLLAVTNDRENVVGTLDLGLAFSER